jgi:hypothetical protein
MLPYPSSGYAGMQGNNKYSNPNSCAQNSPTQFAPEGEWLAPEQYCNTNQGADLSWPQIIQAGSALATVFLTIGLLVATGMQAATADRQRRLMSRQLKTAKIAANAADRAANAALAVIDRPWLTIEGLKNTRLQWMSGQSDLTAEFFIANHGKAPALLVTVQACLFLGYEQDVVAGEPKPPLSVLKFPAAHELKFFRLRLCEWPLVNTNMAERYQQLLDLGAQPGPKIWEQLRFDTARTVGNENVTEVYMWRESPLATESKGEVPADAAYDIFLLGNIIYFGPTIDAETINFCYRANRFGGFEMYGGVPYNERKKTPHKKENPDHGLFFP